MMPTPIKPTQESIKALRNERYWKKLVRRGIAQDGCCHCEDCGGRRKCQDVEVLTHTTISNERDSE